MTTNNKQLVSVRLNGSDLARVKQIAKRLQVRDSELIRFAVKSTLTKLMPLHDTNLAGSDLLPAFIELGAEITNYFELDSVRLNTIINQDSCKAEKRVDDEDIALLAMLAMPEHYLHMRLRELSPLPVEAVGVEVSLRRYLYDKYVRPHRRESSADSLQPTSED